MVHSRWAARRAGLRSPLSAARASLALALLGTKPALACPDCQLGREAWFWFVHDRFALHFVAASVPFLVVAGVSAIFAVFDRSSANGPAETRR